MYRLNLILFIFFCPCYIVAQISYPETLKKTVIDVYHETTVSDDYQWLEQQQGEQVRNWVSEQNIVSLKYLKKLIRKNETQSLMNRFMFRNLGDFDGKIQRTDTEDQLFFKYFVNGTNSTRSLYLAKGQKGHWDILVNSDAIPGKGRIGISSYKISRNKNLVAYQYNRNGSDWKEIRIVKIHKRRHYQEVLKQTITSDIYWLNEGFFYKKYPFDSINAKRGNPQIYYHKLATKQEEDELMFKTHSDNEVIEMFGSKKEDLYIIKRENLKNNTFNYYVLDPLKSPMSFKPFLIRTPYDLNIFDFKDHKVFAFSKIRGKKHLLTIDIDDHTKFKLLSPNYEEAIVSDIELMKDKIVISYYSPDGYILCMIDYDGNLLNDVNLPKGLAVSSIYFNKAYNEFFFQLESYTIPDVLYTLNLKTFEYKMVEETKVNFDFKGYKFSQEMFTSHDGVKVPMFIVYKDSLPKNGETPFLLKTYGGYGNIGEPNYDAGLVYFIENGGAFAYVNIRGGGELGEQWWQSGKGLNKKNGINDFISGAEYLIEQGYTSPKKIAITGGSHGGLIAASAAITRPDLYGSAVIDVGVLDMLRAENFTVGSHRLNIKEYGTVKDSTQFENLYSYSPYHNIDNTKNYPSMLIITGDYDNRVPPFHSYKFAAQLQNNSSQTNPILLWTQENTGHFGADSMYGILQEKSYVYGFLFHELE